MKLTLLPLQKDDIIRVRCEGPFARRDQGDPLQELLGPDCYSHKVLLSLERSPSVDTGGLSWLMQSQKRFVQGGGKLVLYSVPPLILDVLNFACVTPLLHIAPSEVTARELVKQLTAPGPAGEAGALTNGAPPAK